jgi:DNA polymerase I-like protein with 3'-5' exonuclease and polymerase domains
VIGQNLLYDCQYTARWWGFVPNVTQDTMVNQHALYSSLPKSLAFLASLYCDYYVWWKGESKDFYEGEKTTTPEIEDRLWSYNCKDCVYTYEVAEVLARITTHSGMSRVFEAQQSMFTPVLQAMRRGVLIDRERRDAMIAEVRAALTERENFLEMAAGHPLNFDSHKQLTAFFYTDLGLPVQMTRAGKGEAGRPTLDDEALTRLGQLEPCVKPLTNAVADCRTLEKLLSNFLLRELSTDGRMRCSFNIAGTYTYRMSSSADAFGHGTNLQTIPSETTKSAAKAAARGSLLGAFPNIRDIFVPDRGHIWFDLDLQRADLFVVVYEADDHDLKAAMRLGVDMHLLSAFTLLNKEPPPYDELIERHTESDTCSCHGTCYWEHRAKFKHTRQLAKTLIHGTNYCGRPRTMSAHTGRTVAEVERLQRTWFGAHPGIERWHKRVHREITQRRYVENRLGYRWHIFDRADAVLPEAVAWIPQSTVGLVINHIWRRLTALPDVEVLLQVHDSLAGQLPASYAETLLPRIIELSQITVPYDDPLVIPVSIKTSSRSWGDC